GWASGSFRSWRGTLACARIILGLRTNPRWVASGIRPSLRAAERVPNSSRSVIAALKARARGCRRRVFASVVRQRLALRWRPRERIAIPGIARIFAARARARRAHGASERARERNGARSGEEHAEADT